MNKKIITALSIVSMLSLSIPAFAETSVTEKPVPTLFSSQKEKVQELQAKKEQKVEDRMVKGKEKGTSAIDERVAKLNSLLARVNGMKRVTDTGKTSISATIQALIANLTSLKAQIASDSSTTTLKTDVASITKSYRVYALVMPQIQLIATVDRILTLSDELTTIGTKIADRLAKATNVTNLTELQATLADMAAKINDAKTKAGEAMNAISPLVPDEGDKTKMASNTAVLKAAHEKVKLAEAALKIARQDAQKVANALKGKMKKATTTPAI